MKFIIFIILLCSFYAESAAADNAKYAYYLHGSAADYVPVAPPKPASALLVGGGKETDAAFAWFAAQARGGDIVVLRASGGDDYNAYFAGLAPLDSVETLIITSREAANDPFAAERVRRADAIFIAGGDQSNYIKYWKGSALDTALADAMQHGITIGGTSAGLAVLGEYDFAALNDTVTSEEALRDPYNEKMTLDDGFLTAPSLAHTITDSHFSERDRMGRLLAFMARLIKDGNSDVSTLRGIGIDQETSLVLEDGHVRVFGKGSAYFLNPTKAPEQCLTGKTLTFRDVSVVRVDSTGVFDLAQWRALSGPGAIYSISAEGGKVSESRTRAIDSN